MGLLADIADLLLARACVGCTLPGPPLCELCASLLLPEPFLVPDLPPALPPAAAGQPYTGLTRAVVIAHKERTTPWLTPWLGMLLAAAVRHTGEDAPLVPVPSHPRSLRARGRDTVREIAEDAGRRLGLPVLPLLARGGGSRQKARSAERRRSAEDVAPVRLRAPASTRSVILVDDVVATGSTLALCQAALEEGGVQVCAVAAVTASLLQRA